MTRPAPVSTAVRATTLYSMSTAPWPPAGSRTIPAAEDMRAFGQELGATLGPGDLVILDGPLGAGKTTLAQGIARGMDVRGRVTSPTFTIAREHRPNRPGGARLVHADLYRLLDMGGDLLGNLDSLDLDTDLGDCVVVAEWGGGVAEQLSDRHLLVSIDRTADDGSRVVTWRWSGPGGGPDDGPGGARGPAA